MNGSFLLSRFNATRHGLTARHLLLPWEDPAGLEVFIEGRLLPLLARKRAEVAGRTGVREHAFATAAADAGLDRLARYETHLDRKLIRLLSTLLRLQEARRTITGTAASSVSQKVDGESPSPLRPDEVDTARADQVPGG